MKRALVALFWSAALAAACSSTTTAAAPGADDASLIASIGRRAMETGFTPGMSVAVIRGERVTRAAFGVADLASGRAVTPETRFYVASTTKALTALAAAQRAARGQLDLDATLSHALPGASFAPGVSGDSIRVRDLITHTHGIDPAGPISARVAYTGEYENAGILAALAAHRADPRGRAFRYSNLGYDLLGIVLAPDRTHGWKRVVELEVTEPLGMGATTAYRSRVPDGLLALPYERDTVGFVAVPLIKADANMGPAGGHFSTAGDLARLVVAELHGGRLDGRQAIPAEVIASTQRLHAAQDADFAGLHRFGWGLGWDLVTRDGDTLVTRFGSFRGYFSHVSFMPRHKVGVVVLVNGGAPSMVLAEAVAAALYDRLRGVADADSRFEARLAESSKMTAANLTAVARHRAERAARPQQLPHPLASYCGTFENPLWGTLEIRERGGKLEAAMGLASCVIETYNAEKNQLRFQLFDAGEVVQARFGEGDTIARAMAVPASGVVFERKR